MPFQVNRQTAVKFSPWLGRVEGMEAEQKRRKFFSTQLEKKPSLGQMARTTWAGRRAATSDHWQRAVARQLERTEIWGERIFLHGSAPSPRAPRRLRGPILPLSLLNSDQIWQPSICRTFVMCGIFSVGKKCSHLCSFVCLFIKTPKSVLHLPPWDWSKIPGSISTRAALEFKIVATETETFII